MWYTRSECPYIDKEAGTDQFKPTFKLSTHASYKAIDKQEEILHIIDQ